MDLQQINIKVFVTEDSRIDYQNFIKVFNRWIEEADQDDYLNYADYSFTHAGPGVLLISKGEKYSIDNAHNCHGFLYNRKHKMDGSNSEKIRKAFGETLKRCSSLEDAGELDSKVRFNCGEVLFFVNNRHIARNDQRTFDEIKPDLISVLDCMYGDRGFTLERAYEDERERFAIRVSATSGSTISNLLEKLENK